MLIFMSSGLTLSNAKFKHMSSRFQPQLLANSNLKQKLVFTRALIITIEYSSGHPLKGFLQIVVVQKSPSILSSYTTQPSSFQRKNLLLLKITLLFLKRKKYFFVSLLYWQVTDTASFVPLYFTLHIILRGEEVLIEPKLIGPSGSLWLTDQIVSSLV